MMGQSSAEPLVKDLFLAKVLVSHMMMFWGSSGSSTTLLKVTRYLGGEGRGGEGRGGEIKSI